MAGGRDSESQLRELDAPGDGAIVTNLDCDTPAVACDACSELIVRLS
jgi:hypothetical protein